MKKAIYHTEEEGRSLEFDILKTNPNGTVDLGLAVNPDKPEEPLLVVGGCKVTESAEVGACVLVVESSEETSKKKKTAE